MSIHHDHSTNVQQVTTHDDYITIHIQQRIRDIHLDQLDLLVHSPHPPLSLSLALTLAESVTLIRSGSLISQ